MDVNQPFGGVIPGARGAVLAALLRTGEQLTGRQVHGVVGGHSLGAVQDALKAWERLGVVESRAVGRAYVYRVEEDHVAVAPLRMLLDPIATLSEVVRESVDDVDSVVLCAPSAQSGSGAASGAEPDAGDLHLAVIARETWDQEDDLREEVRVRMGNECDVSVYTPASFADAVAADDPAAVDIVQDGVALVGSKPCRRRRGQLRPGAFYAR